MKNNIYFITKTALASVFLIVCSFIKIPFAVPFTMQSFGVFLVAGLMPQNAVLAVLILILVGFLGVPVFSAGTGVAVFVSPTSGFIVGFIITAALAAFVFKKNINFIIKTILLLLCQIVGTYLPGVFGMLLFTNGSFIYILGVAVLPFIVPDLLKIVLAQIITKRLYPAMQKIQKTNHNT